MTRKSVADDQFGRLSRRLAELARRVDKGSVDIESTMDALQLLIEGKQCTIDKDKLNQGTYRVHVAYDMPKNKDQLEAEFSKGGVSELFYGNHEWRNHSSCAQIDQTAGDRTFLLKYYGIGIDIEYENVIAWMGKWGYRPATHLEAYAFAKANPDVQRHVSILALGSFVERGARRYITQLHSGFPRRWLMTPNWFECRALPAERFLFVSQR